MTDLSLPIHFLVLRRIRIMLLMCLLHLLSCPKNRAIDFACHSVPRKDKSPPTRRSDGSTLPCQHVLIDPTEMENNLC